MASDGAARLSYRYYADTNHIRAHTLQMEYEQPVAGGWAVTPLLRVYTQSAASYFVGPNPSFPTRRLIPEDFMPGESTISFDQRTSAYGARTWGLELAKEVNKWWLVDGKFGRYEQRAAWRLGGPGSPGLEPFFARTWQVGLSRRF